MYSNRELTTLGNFPDLQSIGGYFRVFRNAKLTALGDFPVLTNIGIGGTTVPSLNNRYTNNVSMVVEENPRLSDCYYVLTEFLSGGTHAVSGGIYINNNAVGCNSQNGIINTVYQGSITIRTQAEANRTASGTNALRDTLAGKTIIAGNLTIGYTTGGSRSDIDSLSFLSNIVRITGNLIIQRNGQLINLTDLTHLQTIGGCFSVSNNDSLATLDNFPILTSIGVGESFVPSLEERKDSVSIVVEENPILSTCHELTAFLSGGMHAVSGGVYINDNAIGCNSSSEIKTTYRGDITVTTQAAVDSLRTTLSGKTRIVGNLTIGYASGSSQSDINDLTLLSTMSHITGDLIIRKNGQLVHLNALTHLQSVGGVFSVSNNDRLTTLDNFPILTSIGMGNNIYIPSLRADRNNVSIVVEENPILSNCHELTEFLLGGATAVSGDIYINDNAIGCNSENDIKIRYRGNITVTTQAEVNALRTTLSGKTILVGNLTIGYASGNSRSDITDLTPLSSITDITGDVLIQQNGQLVNLNALTHLQTIGGYFSVSSNDSLASLGNFPTLTSIGVGEAFVPSLDDDIENISIVVESNRRLSDCYVLTEFLSSRTRAVSGDIYISNNAIGCNSQNEIKTTYFGDITVTTQEAVNTLRDTLAGKTILVGNLTVGYTSGSSQSNITNLTPLNNMTHITGSLIIQQNGSLVNLNDLNNLQSIGGNFDIRGNSTLTHTGDFPVLSYVGGRYSLFDNDALEIANGLPALDTLGQLHIIGNEILTSLGSYSSVEHIRTSFIIGDQHSGGRPNPKLKDLGDFSNLQSIGGHFQVYDNRELPTLGDFSDLQTIGGGFYVRDNERLTTLGDFSSLTGIVGVRDVYIPSLDERRDTVSIVVENNPRLSTCCVLTEFLSGGSHAVTGQIFIADNGVGCESVSDLNESTLTLISSNATLAHNETAPLSIEFHVGCVATGWTSSISYSLLGTNFITLSSTNATQTGKVVITATSMSNMGVERTATITLRTSGGRGTSSQTIVITQTQDPAIYYGDIQVTTQSEVDVLRGTLSGKTIINGNLTIGHTSGNSRSDINDLTPLSNMTHITGNLTIQQNGSLVNLNALNNQQSIGGDFYVRSNDQLTTLGNFSDLQTIGGFFRVDSNNKLTTPGNFPDLQSIGGYFRVVDNDTLPTLIDFPDLQTIGGYFQVSSNNILTSLGKFPVLQTIGEYFQVSSNNTLPTLGDFPILTSIGTGEAFVPSLRVDRNNVSIVVENNSSLSDCYVLTEFLSDGITAVNGGIYINDNVISCNSENDIKIRYRGDIIVTTQAEVNVLSTTLSGKTRIVGNLTVGHTSGNSRSDINDLTPLNNMSHITGSLIIQQNGSLVNLNDLTHLQSIGGYFSVSSNDSLASLGNFPTLTSIGVGEAFVPSLDDDIENVSIVVEENPRLSDCYILTEFISGGTTVVSGGIYINDNAIGCNSSSDIKSTYLGDITVATQSEVDVLRTTLSGKTILVGNLTIGYASGSSRSDINDLTPLNDMNHITGSLIIQQNRQLVNLNHLNNLQTIGGYFGVSSNDQLTTLGDFPALTSIGVGEAFVPSLDDDIENISIVVESNRRLSDCYVLTEFLSSRTRAVSGDIYISNNAIGCNSSSDIKSTYLGDITVTTQTEVNALRTTLSGKTIINGNLTIGHTDSTLQTRITGLTPLSNIVHITGSLIIQQNGSLVNLNGLTHLQTIGGYFGVVKNNTLPTLGDFPVLQSIGGVFYVTNNDTLTSLGNFPALMSIGVGEARVPSLDGSRNNISIVVEDNSSLSDCYILTEFISGGTTVVSGDIYINDNAIGCNSQNEIKIRYRRDITVTTQAEVDALRDTLSGKTILVGNLTIGYTTGISRSDITDLTPLSNITDITGDVLIQQNGKLVNLNALNNLKSIGGYFNVQNNDTLPALGDFSDLQSIGEEFYVTNNDVLTTLGNFSTLTSIGRSNGIYIPSLNGNRNDISIVVENNSSLSDCYILTEFISGGTTVVSGGIYVNNNAMGCNSQNEIKIRHRGDIIVTTQAEVDTLRGTLFGKIIIVGNLTVGYSSGNSQTHITNLTSLSNISRITGNVFIQQNRSLVNLTGLNNIETIGGYFSVSSNDQLTSLGNFPALMSIGVGEAFVPSLNESRNSISIVVENNSSLSDCYVLTEFISDGTTVVSGGIYINDNTIGCNSQNEIKSTYLGDITVTTQAEVNALRTTLAGKTIINGNLTIGHTDSTLQTRITGLTPLSNITHITGDLTIQQNGQLIHLTGLNNLQSIGEEFYVTNNDQLTNLGNFPTLTSIGVGEAFVPSLDGSRNNISIVVEDNSSLSDCYILTEFISGGATVVSGDIYINDNAIGCNSQNEIKSTYLGDITVTTQAEVDALRDTLSGKTIINGNLTIGHTSGNSRSDITDLTPLSKITDITGDVLIQQNGKLVNLNALNNLKSIGGYFNVQNNDTLPTLGDFSDLQSIGEEFYVTNNDVLTTLGNFPTLTSIGRSNGIYIPSLNGNRNDISIVVEENPRLSDCYVLTEFLSGGTTVVSGRIYINNNAMGCNSQNEIKIRHRGDIIVTTQAEVDTLRGTLFGKTIIVGNLTVGYSSGNSQTHITNLTSLSNIVHITGNVFIQQNGSLVNLTGLNNIETIGGYFSVSSNDTLTSLGNFPNLTSIGIGNVYVPSLNESRNNVSIVVENNFNLSDCYVLTDFLTDGTRAVSGDIYINNNVNGCNSQNEITEAEKTIYRGDITVITQAEVNALRDTLVGKTRIVGNLTIGYTSGGSRSDITDLTPLRNMTRITGNVLIQQNRQLVDLTGFNNLQSIGGYFGVVKNNTLPTLGTFPNLTSIGIGNVYVLRESQITENVSIVVEENPRLSNCHVLTEFLSGGATAVSGEIYINNNAISCNSENDIKIRYRGDITVTTQVQVNALRTTLSGKTIIVGNLTVGETSGSLRSDITDLTPLSSITDITGDVLIQQNGQLVDLTGLNDLQSIGGYFGVVKNNTLPTLGTFPNLTSIGIKEQVSVSDSLMNDVSIVVEKNPRLSDCHELTDFLLGGTTAVSGGIYINENAIGCNSSSEIKTTYLGDITVTTQAEVNALRDTLAGKTIINGNLTIGHADSILRTNISDLTPLISITDITGYVLIQQNGQLVNLTKLNKLQTIGGYFGVVKNNTLSTLGNFSDLQTIGGGFHVTNNDTLTSLGKFPTLMSIGADNNRLTPSLDDDIENISIVVKENPRLSDCDVLTDFLSGGATSVSGGIYINNNAIGCNSQKDIKSTYINDITVTTQSEVDTLRGTLSSKTIIIGNLTVGYVSGSSRSDITDLTPLSSITGITGNVLIQQNRQLVNLNDLNNLQTIGGYFSVSSNDTLTSLGDFPNLQTIGEYFSVTSNDTLTSLGDFPNLQTIGGYFGVVKNNTLTSLGNFPNLQTIGGGFHVTNNDTLTSLGNFPELMSIGTSSNVFVPSLSRNGNNVSIVVEENTRLSDCYVLTEFLLGGTHAVSGGIYIKDNAISCNSENDIKIRYSGDITVTTQAEVDTLRITLADKTIIVGNLTVGYTTGSSRSDIIDLTPLSNIVHITENVLIQQNGQLVNLDGLNTLQTIEGYFSVWMNDTLPSLGNFLALQSIGGEFYITNNDSLIILGNFPVLQSIGGYFSVTSNDRLTSLGNFPNLTNIGTSSNVFVPSLSRNGNDVSIVVEKNPRLSDCHELTKFISGGTRTVSGGIYINDNAIGCNSQDEIKTRYRGDITVTTQAEVDDLSTILFEKTIIVGNLIIGDTSGVSRSDITDLTLLSSIILITDITGDVLIQQNGKLVFEGLQHLKSIGGYFGVVKNDTLTTLGNFPALQSIGEDFYVTNNDILTDLGNFPVLTSIGIGNNRLIPSLDGVRNNVSIVVKENPRLSNCDALTGFLSGGTTVVSGDIYINENAIGCNSQDEIKTTYRGDITVTTQEEVNALHNTLSGKTIINGNLTIGYVSGSSRSDITDLTPLSSITDVTGYVRIQQNGQLVNLNALTHLQSIGGEFYIANNDSLASLGDFPDLQTIGGYFSVFLNKRLTTLGNFPDLQTIGRYFRVRNNDILTTLGDFSVLQTIGGYFSVFRNKRLTTLGDFPDLQTIEGYFSIYKNDTLTTFGNFPALTSIGSGSTHVPSEEGMVDNVSIVVEENPRLSDCCVLASFINEENNRIKGAKFIIDNAPGCNEDTIQNTCHTLVVTTKKIHEIAYDNTEPISISLTVGGISTGWASGITYAPNTNFITLNPPKKNETGNFTIMVTPTANEDIIPRSAIIILRTTGREGTPDSVSLTIKQAAAPMIMLTSHTDGDSIVIIHDDTNPIPISFTLGGSATSSMSSISYTPENTNFITLEPENNDEETRTITITPSVNEDIIPRTATITLRTTGHEGTPDSVSLTIKQAAAPMIMLTSHTDGDSIVIIHDDTNPIPISFTLGGSATSSMSSISYMPENANFIMLQPENNNEETRAITITPLANTNTESRSATITLVTTGHEGTPDSVSLTITQETSPTIMLISHTEDENITIAYDNTEFIPISFTAGGTVTDWTSAITYTPANANFITLSPTEGTSQTDTITLMATPTENTGVERTATITLITTGIGTPDSVSLTITQETSPTIMLISHTEDENITIAYDNTDPITIDFTLGGSATSSMSNISYMPENTNFITLQPEDNDEETTSITITPSINEDTIPRTAAITLRTTGHEGTPDSVSLTITQGARADTTVTMPPTDTTTTLYSYTRVDFSLYPNPTKGTLTIEGVTGFLQMYIHDLVGREVMTYSLTPSKKTIDVSDLPSGMYVVTLQGEDKTWKETLMKR